jgi:hypothetical protein
MKWDGMEQGDKRQTANGKRIERLTKRRNATQPAYAVLSRYHSSHSYCISAEYHTSKRKKIIIQKRHTETSRTLLPGKRGTGVFGIVSREMFLKGNERDCGKSLFTVDYLFYSL